MRIRSLGAGHDVIDAGKYVIVLETPDLPNCSGNGFKQFHATFSQLEAEWEGEGAGQRVSEHGSMMRHGCLNKACLSLSAQAGSKGQREGSAEF